MRTYIERHGDLVLKPPILADRLKMFAFLIEGQSAALQALLDASLNMVDGSPFHFRPLARHILVSFEEIAHLASGDPTDRDIGWASEREVAIWMLVGTPGLDRPFLYNPYIFVDNPITMTIGREVYGFPKQAGWVELPSVEPLTPFSVDGQAVATLGAGNPITRERLITITREANAPGPAAESWEALDMVWRRVLTHIGAADHHTLRRRRWLPRWRSAGAISRARHVVASLPHLVRALISLGKTEIHLAESFSGGRVPILLLKQFRSAGDNAEAAYQALVTSTVSLRGFHGAGLLAGKHTCQFASLASHPFAADLGFASPAAPVTMGFWVDVDFTLAAGQELWRAS